MKVAKGEVVPSTRLGPRAREPARERDPVPRRGGGPLPSGFTERAFDPFMVQRPSPPELLAQWTEVDRYYERIESASDPVLEATLRASQDAGLPAIQVSPLQGKLLQLLARTLDARRILEIGTLGGYSTIWLARSLPSTGRLVTLEIERTHAEIARVNLERAGLLDRVEVRLGPARETLRELRERGEPPFDLVFIDADKPSYAEYFDGAVALSRRGTLIVIDNVVRRGDVIEEESSDPQVLGVRRMNDRIAREGRVVATTIQTVGSKGYDGFTLARVERAPRERERSSPR